MRPCWRGKPGRPMTPGEIGMASALFGDAIDYTRVEVHARRYLPFGLQPKNCAMTPNGTIYFDKSCCLPDFSAGSEHARHWFMHEMVHVWQHQLGYPVWWRGAVRIGLSYRYELAEHKTLADFNMEAQGDLLADYFVLKFLHSSTAMRQQRYAKSLALFETVLTGFRRHPAGRNHLPGARRLA
ncbi:Rhs element Vgr protein [Massilia sp. CCM 9210]|uniref:Rhs element Vgr protein n=1 Tax=Massilia scottii TaxID=3057166 RepID=UPI002796AA28|nr:Rhs element Vgr protein [Massilia sp. CCM 9210]MDQ1816570.1 Rhs element Vgr protein [Massilia sp. CCM 9210]